MRKAVLRRQLPHRPRRMSAVRLMEPKKSSASRLCGAKKDVSGISQEKIGAIAGLVRADQGAKILKDKVSHETASKQYDRAIQTSEKPANLIIDALKLDYQHADIDRFAGHLWKLYQTLGNYGRQVKERMLG